MSETNFSLPASIGLTFSDGITINNGTTTVINSVDWYSVDDYGAVGDGATDDTDAIQACLDAAGQYAVIFFTGGKTYLINSTINSYSYQTWIGYGSTLKKGNQVVTTLAQTAQANDTELVLTDATGFLVGDEIVLVDIVSGGSVLGENDISDDFGVNITAINSNTITLDAGISLPLSGNLTEWAAGQRVGADRGMIKVQSDSAPINIYGLTIDGNKSNNDWVYSWNVGLSISSFGNESRIKDCIFQNHFGEIVYPKPYTVFESCIFKENNGSAIHISGGGDGTYTISNCQFINCNLIANSITGHSEAAITFSSRAARVLINNCVFDNCEGVAGPVTGGGSDASRDNHILISNCQAFDCDNILFTGTAGRVLENLKITDSHFINCGFIKIGDSGNLSDDGMRDATDSYHTRYQIENNNFLNCWFEFWAVNNLVFRGNSLTFEESFTSDITEECAILFSDVMNVLCDSNIIENQQETYDDDLPVAIRLDHNITDLIVDSGGTSVYLHTPRHVKITNNQITNWKTPYSAVKKGVAQTGFQADKMHIGIEIINNLMTFREDTNVDEIWLRPGEIFEGNTIYGTSNVTAVNVGSITNANANNYNGSIVRYNKILGCAVPLVLGRSGQNNSSMVVTDNLYTGTIEDNQGTGTNNVIERNTAIQSETWKLKVFDQDRNLY